MQPPIDYPHSPSIGPPDSISEHSLYHDGTDAPPYVPPPGVQFGESGSNDLDSERGPLGLLGIALFVIIAIIMIAMVASSGMVDSSFGGLFVLAIIVMIIFAVARFAIVNSSPPVEPAITQSPPITQEVRIETVRETVKVRCRYCGSLNLETNTKCQSCGGNL